LRGGGKLISIRRREENEEKVGRVTKLLTAEGGIHFEINASRGIFFRLAHNPTKEKVILKKVGRNVSWEELGQPALEPPTSGAR